MAISKGQVICPIASIGEGGPCTAAGHSDGDGSPRLGSVSQPGVSSRSVDT